MDVPPRSLSAHSRPFTRPLPSRSPRSRGSRPAFAGCSRSWSPPSSARACRFPSASRTRCGGANPSLLQPVAKPCCEFSTAAHWHRPAWCTEWPKRPRTPAQGLPKRAMVLPPRPAQHPPRCSKASQDYTLRWPISVPRQGPQCHTESRNASPMFDRTGRTTVEVAQHWPAPCQTWPNLGRHRPTLARVLPISARAEPKSIKIGLNSGKSGPRVAKFDHNWPGVNQSWQKLARSRPMFARCHTSAAQVGPESANVCPNSMKIGPMLAMFGQNWLDVRPKLARCSATVGQIWTGLGQVGRPTLDQNTSTTQSPGAAGCTTRISGGARAAPLPRPSGTLERRPSGARETPERRPCGARVALWRPKTRPHRNGRMRRSIPERSIQPALPPHDPREDADNCDRCRTNDRARCQTLPVGRHVAGRNRLLRVEVKEACTAAR